MMSIYNDEPEEIDSRGREKLKKEFVEIIGSCTPPHVFGLHGDWGSGKTSFLRQLRLEIDPIAQPVEANKKVGGLKDGVVTIWFEAWRYQDESAPIVALLQEMRRQLTKINKVKSYANQAKKITDVTARTLLGAFDDVAKILKIESISTKNIQSVADVWEKEHLQTKLGADNIREFLQFAITDLLASVTEAPNPKLVIFIDDLDRCQPSTAFKLLESLKVHFSLPNCIFILGMNQQTVVGAIASELKKDENDVAIRLKAEAYLEKLCGNFWRLPLLSNEKSIKYFSSLLFNSVNLKFSYEKLIDIKCLPPNPRRLKALANTVNRFAAQLFEDNNPDKEKNLADENLHFAILIYSYIYQFHGDLFRRWQWDPDYFLKIKEFVDGKFQAGSMRDGDSELKRIGFDGLFLPQGFKEESDDKISHYPDPSVAGVFWIAALIQKNEILKDIKPIDFKLLHQIDLR